MATVPSRQERWLALGLLLAVLALAYALLVHPAWTVPMRETDQRIRDLVDREQRIRMQLQQAPEIGRRLQEAAGVLAERPGFLPEPSAELASAGLAQRLAEAVSNVSPDGSTCTINNRSPLPQEAAEGRYVRVSVRAHLRCGVSELAAVVHALEGGSPRLFVDNVDVLVQLPADGQEGGGGLEASFDLSGYLAPESVARAPSEVPDAP